MNKKVENMETDVRQLPTADNGVFNHQSNSVVEATGVTQEELEKKLDTLENMDSISEMVEHAYNTFTKKELALLFISNGIELKRVDDI